jgi:D-alanyl-D-alanine carboxypeptidase/D-alanyl-D-alanine-endopeptidase (penicillin-binding protein 4)
MRRLVLAACLLAGALAAAGSARAETPLARSLERALDARALRDARVGALVVRLDDGSVLFERDADASFIPASNQKILTAIAALSTFGPTRTFPLDVYTTAPPDAAGRVAGDLVVRSAGDPSLTAEDFWRLAAQLRAAGLRSVKGDLVVDDTAFDAVRWQPNWGEISARAYHAPVGAFTVNYGAFAAEVAAGAVAGDPVRVSVDPPVDYLAVVNRAVTGPPRGRNTLVVSRRAAGAALEVTVSGRVPAGTPAKTYYRSVLDPTAYAAAVLRMQLAAVGIDVAGGVRRGAAPAQAEPLLRFEGNPLSEVVRLFLKFSNNTIAESLVKLLGAASTGRPGSWANGMPALREALQTAGLDVAGMTLVDGSGLSYDNRVTPRQLVAALRAASTSFRIGPEFVAGLPIAAADGTLEKRAGDAASAVRAKTGLLTRVTSLSGFAELKDGTRVAFSVLVNGFRGPAERAMAAVDGFVAQLTLGTSASPPRPPPPLP